MPIPIKPRRTFTTGKVPTTADLSDGEMGVNVPDGKIYVRQGSDIKLVGSKAEGTGVVETIESTNTGIGAIGITVNSSDPKNVKVGFYGGFQPNNTVYAGPDMLYGDPSFRALNERDIPTLPASKIGSGVIDKQRLPYPLDFIDGLKITTTATVITVSPGTVCMPDGAVVTFAGGTNTASRASNTTYNLYISNGGSLMRLGTVPDIPYYNTARHAQGITGYRYIGSVRTDSSGNYLLQTMTPGANWVEVAYLNNTTTNAVLQNGGATIATDVSLAAYLPKPAVKAQLLVRLEAGSAGVGRLYCWDGAAFNIWGNIPYAPSQTDMIVPCDSTPKIRYDVTGVSGLTLAVRGYTYER